MGSEVPQRGPDPREPHVGVTDVTSLPGNMTVTTEAVTTALEEASAAGPHSFILSAGACRGLLCARPWALCWERARDNFGPSAPKPHRPEGN